MAYVSGASNTAATANNQTVTYSPSAGNTVVFGVFAASQSATLSSIIDSAAHTYTNGSDMTLYGPFNTGGANGRGWVAVIPNVASGLTSFKGTISASGVMDTALGEWSGRATALANIVDVENSAADSGAGTSIADGTATVTTTNAADDLVEVFVTSGTTSAWAGGHDQAAGAGGSYTVGPTGQQRMTIMKVDNLGSTGLYQAGMSWTGSVNWRVTVIALAPPPSGAQDTPELYLHLNQMQQLLAQ